MHKASITTSEFFLIIGMIVISMFLYGVIEKISLKESTSISHAYLNSIKAQLMQYIYLLDSSLFYASPLVYDLNQPLKLKQLDNHTLELSTENDVTLLFYPFTNFILEQQGYYRKLYIYKLYNNTLLFSSHSIYCNNNERCEEQECMFMCADCSLFSNADNTDICSNDGICNVYIGEDCSNAPQDCVCEQGKVCDVSNPLSDAKGCVSVTKHKGEVCYDHEECYEGLICYKKEAGDLGHCCPIGYVWDKYSHTCKEKKLFRVLFIPVGYEDKSEFFEYDVSVIVDELTTFTPLKECEHSLDYNLLSPYQASLLESYTHYKQKCSNLDEVFSTPLQSQECAEMAKTLISEVCSLTDLNDYLNQVCSSGHDVENSFNLVFFLIHQELPQNIAIEGSTLLKDTVINFMGENRKAVYGKIILMYAPSLLDEFHELEGYGRAVALHEFGHAVGFYHTSLNVCDSSLKEKETCCKYLEGASLPPFNKDTCIHDLPSNVMNYYVNTEEGRVKEEFSEEEYLLLKSFWQDMGAGEVGIGAYIECEGN